MKNKFIKLGMLIVLVVVIVILVRQNVTTRKETNTPEESNKVIALDINSELVQDLYKKLILFEDAFNDENYKYLYFNFEDEKKSLSADEKLYIVFDSLYKSNKFQVEEVDENDKKLNISKNEVNLEYESLFKETINETNIYYKTSKDCGIVGYVINDDEYELTFRGCDDEEKIIDKVMLVSASKNGNFIDLKTKAFQAVYNKRYSKKNALKYDIKNYNDEKSLKLVEKEDVIDNSSEISTMGEINSYVFSFELKGDNYYLSSIRRESMEKQDN